MYARSNTVQVRQGAMDELVAWTRDETWPALRAMEGNIGMSMMCDRDGNRCILTTAWRDRAAMTASAGGVAPLRQRIRDDFATGDVQLQEWEIAVVHREHPAGDGAWARMTWIRTDPGRVEEMLQHYRSTVMPWIQDMRGFCSLSMLVDRDSGRAVGTGTFASRADLENSRDRARSMRERTGAEGFEVLDVAEMEVALAHLRVPETV